VAGTEAGQFTLQAAAACDFCSTFRYCRSHRSQQRRCFLSLVNFSLWRPWRAIFLFPAAGENKAEAYRVSRLGPVQIGRPGERVCQVVIRSRRGGAELPVEGIVETKCGVAGRRGGGETISSFGGRAGAKSCDWPRRDVRGSASCRLSNVIENQLLIPYTASCDFTRTQGEPD
jgi:hypothetical protein